MANIWRIFVNDWKNIFRTLPVLLLVLGLMILPSAYAWINIKSMWDPYGNTSGILVAVVNEDDGAVALGKPVNAGEELVKSLKKNKKLGWRFMNQESAIRGVNHGDYYAYLIIPKDFSEKLTSILEANPQKPEITFGVNEKINAIAPKITSSGASGIMTEISDTFTKTVGDVIFTIFNKAGIELQKDLPSIQKAENKILELEKALPLIERIGSKAIDLEGKWVRIQAASQQIMELENHISELDQMGERILKVEEALPLMKDGGKAIADLDQKIEEIRQISSVLEELIGSISEVETNTKQAIYSMKTENGSDNQENTEEMTRLLQSLERIHQSLAETKANNLPKTEGITSTISSAADAYQNDFPLLEQQIHQAADFVRNDLDRVKDQIHESAAFIKNKLPEAGKVIHQAADFARNDLPGFKTDIHKAADKIRSLNRNVNMKDLIEFLTHDPEKESNFLSKPIVLHTKRIFPIPNYGSAMTPFYTMLALWVGATLLISSLKVDVEDSLPYRDYQKYTGRLLTFLTIGIIQAVIVTLGDLYLLHCYVVDKLAFILLSVFISIVFVIITFTLCAVFGNIGKGLAIIFLVLQISSSGSTFPVSMTSAFFQALNPFMPFTYAISMLREAVGGMIQEIVIRDMLALLCFVGTSLLLALVLKKPLSRWIEGTALKAKSSKMIP
ncbi:YhgE/Pip domain-containing protein [Bacillus sp. JJ1122]|uniref:YhgE/Pip domain-containing protein n=1 Tax=Bacillus sp. JJ1122 TaxID=3122951 RepID=UPI002FFE0D32